MSHDGHERVEYACGHVIRQCRCMGPKTVTTLDHPCEPCAKKGWPKNVLEPAQENALPDGPERELQAEEMRLANELLYAVKDVGMRDKRGRLHAWRDAIEHVKAMHMRLDVLGKAEEIDLVFDGGPGPEGPRFIEAERKDGTSVSVGEWIQRPGTSGWWVLRLRVVR